MPFVSILCTVFNHEAFLSQCLIGFISQKTNFAFEVIVHDDCSTDSSIQIIKEYATKYPDIIKPYFEEENQYSKKDGSLWRNIMNRAKGKYIAFCEGDDYWTDPYKLQKQFDFMESHPKYTICFHHVQDVTIDDKIIYKSGSPRYYGILWDKTEITLEDYLKELCYHNNFTYQLSSYFIKRENMEFFVNHQTTLYRYFPYQDVPIVLSALFSGKAYCIKEVMSHYRALSGGFTSKLFANKENQIALAKNELVCYREIDHYLKGAYHLLIKYRLRRNQLAIESHLGDNYLTQFKPKFWLLLKFQPLRATLSYLIKGILIRIGLRG